MVSRKLELKVVLNEYFYISLFDLMQKNMCVTLVDIFVGDLGICRVEQVLYHGVCLPIVFATVLMLTVTAEIQMLLH